MSSRRAGASRSGFFYHLKTIICLRIREAGTRFALLLSQANCRSFFEP
jgi:hypothetical protein